MIRALLIATFVATFGLVGCGSTPNNTGPSVTVQNPELLYASGVRTSTNLYILGGKTSSARLARAKNAVNIAATINSFVSDNGALVPDMSLARKTVDAYILDSKMDDLDKQALRAFNAEIFDLIEDGVIQVSVGNIGVENAATLRLIATNVVRAAHTHMVG